MFNNDQEKYYNYVETNDVEVIIKEFGEKCGLKEKQKDADNKEEDKKQEEKNIDQGKWFFIYCWIFLCVLI